MFLADVWTIPRPTVEEQVQEYISAYSKGIAAAIKLWAVDLKCGFATDQGVKEIDGLNEMRKLIVPFHGGCCKTQQYTPKLLGHEEAKYEAIGCPAITEEPPASKTIEGFMKFREDWRKNVREQTQKPRLICLVYEAAKRAAMQAKASGADAAGISTKAIEAGRAVENIEDTA